MRNVTTILSSAEIEKIIADDFANRNYSPKEYNPWFLDSISDLENRTKFNVTKMPAKVIYELDEELLPA